MTSKPSAVLVLNPADNNQGFLLPQIPTTSRVTMTPKSPDEDGLLVFDITEKQFYYWKNGQWVKGFSNNGSNQQGNSGPSVAYHSIDPSDFSGLRTVTAINKANALIFEDNNTYITSLNKADGTSFIAPIHLPDGATIQKITLYYMDREATNMIMNVYRRPFAGANEAIISTWTSTGTSTTIQNAVQTPLIGKDIIDNSTYSYRVVVKLNPGLDTVTSADPAQRIYGIQIQYLK
ncbi:MAG TPA: hypothetical protein VF473_08930 [Cyclobacteriaceae bacterium]